jgi:hypothetical protein
MKGWTKIHATEDDINRWDIVWPLAKNTGILTRDTPGFDADILTPDAAEDVETLVREHFEDRGVFMVRFGRVPKRAFLLRTDTPFKKITANLISPDGVNHKEKIELLADGQQIVCFGIHKDTGKPYSWFGGEPGQVRREDLPCITEAEAREIVEPQSGCSSKSTVTPARKNGRRATARTTRPARVRRIGHGSPTPFCRVNSFMIHCVIWPESSSNRE